MGLLDKTNPTPNIDFADEPTDVVTGVEAGAAMKASVPAVAKPSSLAVAMGSGPSLEDFKDALPVDYNTLNQVIVNQGNFIDRESKKSLGDAVTFELLSFQDSWVLTPGDDRAPKELLRFSNDGQVCTEGTPVQEHLAFLKTTYPRAALKKRAVLVGAILKTAKNSADFDGKLVQFDLSPQSMAQWERYKANGVYAILKGRLTKEAAAIIDAKAELTSMNGNDFTVAKFTQGTAP